MCDHEIAVEPICAVVLQIPPVGGDEWKCNTRLALLLSSLPTRRTGNRSPPIFLFPRMIRKYSRRSEIAFILH